MWNKVDLDIWNSIIEDLNLPVFYHADFLNATAQVFDVSVDCYVFKKKEKTLALGAFYVKGKKIVIPEKFSFTALWFSEGLKEINLIESTETLLNLFKQKYSNIYLKLDPKIKDIRPFIWADFNIENKYTYIKKEGIYSHYSIEKNLSKLPPDYYTFKVSDLDEHSLSINLKFLKKLGFSRALTNRYKYLIIHWDRIGIIKSFNIYKLNELVCSNIAIVDKNKIYTILLNSVSSDDKYAHTYLYTSIIDWGNQNRISEIDFCGANMRGISNFKSYFNPKLQPYYIVRYSFLQKVLLFAAQVVNKL